MLQKIKELADRLEEDYELSAQDKAYLEQVTGNNKTLFNFIDDQGDGVLYLALDAAKAIGLTQDELDAMEYKMRPERAPKPASQPTTPQASSVYDFDRSGLGIGGINNSQEMPFVPSVAAIERVQRMEDEMTVCRRCGQNDAFGGAMFTTGGGDICDDCFG